MAGENDSRPPWGDALAPFERDGKTIWIDLGPVWKGETGALTMQLYTEPLHWRSHGAERRIVIREREKPPAPEPSKSEGYGKRSKT